MSKKFFPATLLTFVFILILGVGAFAYYQYIAPKPPLPNEPLTQQELQTALAVNFSEVGDLSDWDSRTEKETGNWILLYGKPGNPAVIANLKFDNNSKCDLGDGEKICDVSKLVNGDRASVTGNANLDVVTVIKLQKQ